MTASALSGCKHSTFPKAPTYRECLFSQDDNGKNIIYCRTMNTDKKISEEYPATENYLTQFLMTPLQDVPRLEKFEAEVKTWVDLNCKGK